MRAGCSVLVRVPASSANLGPGFDALGLALQLYDVVELSTADEGVLVEVHGEGDGELPRDERHLVLRAVRSAFHAMREWPRGLRLSCQNAIPQSRGLGSSAAAVVAGVVAARALVPDGAARLGDTEVLRLAADFERHADNVAASLFGGLALAWAEADGFAALRLEPHPDLTPVVLVTAATSSTETTRALLPQHVPLADAAFTAGHSALALHALTVRPDLLLAATEDRLHQPYRRPAYPASAELVDALRVAGVPAVISGAGPTVLALPAGGALPAGLVPDAFTVRPLAVDRAGVRVEVG